MTPIILLVHDAGDPSVGISPRTWRVDVPMCKEDADSDELEWFRKDIIFAYKDFADGRLTAEYDFEINNQICLHE